MTPNTPDAGSLALNDEFVDEQDTDRSRMSFLEHLDELRRRILYSIYAILACCALTFYFWDVMFEYMVRYFAANGGTLIYTNPAGGFMFSLKIGFLSGLLLALPFVFSQLWMFIAPGLYAKEKKVVIPFVFFSSLLFAAGAWFGHVIAYPAMWRFFASYELGGEHGLKFFPAVDDTFSFYWKIIVGLGAIFQMPMLVFFLARFGVVTAGFLARKFKYAILIIFIIAAIITPSADIVTQCIFAAPMLGLYAISIVVAWIFQKKKRKDSHED